MSVYPITDWLKAEVPPELHDNPAVAAIIETLGEYEHGTADVEDVGGPVTGAMSNMATVTLEQYAAVALDLCLMLGGGPDEQGPPPVDPSPKPSKPRQTTIAYQTWNQDQSWHYERILRLGDHKLRIYGRHNAYRHQSYISLQKWDGTQWQHLKTISGAVMATWNTQYGPGGPESQYTRKVLSHEMLDAFLKDETVLVNLAKQLLF